MLNDKRPRRSLSRALLALTVLMLTAGPAAAQEQQQPEQQPGARYAGPAAHPEQWPAPTRYLSPQGSDSSAGATPSEAWHTFDHALAQLRPGDVLGVMDGVYAPETTGLLYADCRERTFNGLAEQPITVRAVHERQPVLHSDGLVPAVWITRCRNWNVLGLTAVGADKRTEANASYNATTKGMEPVYVLVGVHRSRNVALKRMLATHSNRLGKNSNNHVYAIENSSDVLVEESEAYDHHRHGMIAWRSEHVTFRRCYVNPRDHWKSDLFEAFGRAREHADEAIAFYRSSWGLIENSITEGRNVGFHAHGGDTYALHPGGSYNHVLGSIALNNEHASRIDARRHPYPQPKPAIGNVVKDFVAIGARHNGLWYSTVVDGRAENITVFNAGTGFSAGSRSEPPCEAVSRWGGCSHALKNALVVGSRAHGIWNDPSYTDWSVDFSNAYNNAEGNYYPADEEIGDAEGHVRHSMSEQPTHMGLGEGACVVFVPERSNMKGAGEGGRDIGANVLYRYQDGALTEEPLWDPQTGAFPHGAVVDSLNGVAGNSLMDVHARLNVNTNGCRLPYAEEPNP